MSINHRYVMSYVKQISVMTNKLLFQTKLRFMLANLDIDVKTKLLIK